MDIVEFLTTSKKQSPVVLFRAQSAYPAQFFVWLLPQYKNVLRCQVLDLDESPLASIKVALHTSFLGQPCLYWLRNISDITHKSRTDILHLLSDYQGPNTILLFAYNTDVTKVGSSSWQEVVVPDELSQKDFIRVTSMVQALQHAHQQEAAQLIFQQRKSLVFDEFFMVHRYLQVLGSKQLDSFFNEWFQRIVTSDSSLFALSKHFFAKDSRLFFIEWSKNVEKYNEQFWIVFWAEQLWRAAIFIVLARKNQRAHAKQIAYKLPFTFLQSGWRDYSVRELKAAHAFIYGLDVQTKSGASAMGIDLFFSTFFAGEFLNRRGGLPQG
jgi:hypothetical protein